MGIVVDFHHANTANPKTHPTLGVLEPLWDMVAKALAGAG